MLVARIHASIPAALTLGVVGVAARAQPVFPDILEFEVESAASVMIDTLPTPLLDSATAFDADLMNPEAEAVADIPASSRRNPRAYCEVIAKGREIGSTSITLDADMFFDLQPWIPGPSPRERLAEGSWSHRLVFEIDRAARVDLSIRPSLFDDIDFIDYEPGRLTGPDGVVVSGPPTPGATAWIWQLTLDPGTYTFETFGAFEFAVGTADGASDRASLDVSFTFSAAPCRADLDGDGSLTIFDFLEFQNLFDAGNLEADFDGDGELTLFDFLAFQNAFDAGCE